MTTAEVSAPAALNKKRQKVYTSIEIHPNLNEKGAYLMGLAVTDSPASLGTEMLQFCSKASANPLADRKQYKECLFTEALETVIEFEDEADKGPSIMERVTALFSTHKKQATADFSDVHQAVEAVAKEVTTLDADLQKKFTEQAQTITELTSKQDATDKALADLNGNTAAFLASVLQCQKAVINRGCHVVSVEIIHAENATFFL